MKKSALRFLVISSIFVVSDLMYIYSLPDENNPYFASFSINST